MSRFSRINTIWRKELADTLRDRRTLVAMIIVPMVLYPALMLGSLQAFELQAARTERSEFTVAVATEAAQRWLRNAIDTDISRQVIAAGVPAEDVPALLDKMRTMSPDELLTEDVAGLTSDEIRQRVARIRPLNFNIIVVDDVLTAVQRGDAAAGVLVDGPLPDYAQPAPTTLKLIFNQTDFRSAQFAMPGLEGVLQRLSQAIVAQRLEQHGLPPTFIEPINVLRANVATAEQQGGHILGQIVPLILIVMTITGAIYPAIDLTAGERERGTLETLMVAPVPTVDLIAGKFIVVTLIGMLSAALNLASVGGTIYLGGFGQLLARGGQVVIPLHTLPWVLMVLIPLAVMFSAILLAVCSFARSFKEAQNYIMPVMIAALIPAVVGSLPGTRLEGPLLVIPVTNIVLLSRELFVGQVDPANIIWVTVSTSLYAGAAVAAAAKLFGQEAVLFSDSGSIKTLFVRRFFKPRPLPTAALAFLLLAVTYLLTFFLQQSMQSITWFMEEPRRFLGSMILVLVLCLGVLPVAVARYSKVRLTTAFNLAPPPAAGWLAALCFGASTWILAVAWLAFQNTWLPIPPEVETAYTRIEALLTGGPVWLLLLAAAITPAFVEELFFRGFLLNGLRGALGVIAAVAITAAAFAMFHHSIHRLMLTAMLGLLYGLLAVRTGSIWPCVLAHLLNNGLQLLRGVLPSFKEFMESKGLPAEPYAMPAPLLLTAAAGLLVAGILLCLVIRPRPQAPPPPQT